MSFLKRFTKPKPSTWGGQPTDLYHYKTRFAMLGTVGSGKSAIAAGIMLTAQMLSAKLPGFFCRPLEGNTSNILADASNLRRGRFPEKTPPHLTTMPESGLLLTYSGLIGQKRVHIPFADIAGEDLHQLIGKVRQFSPLDQRSYQANVALINNVRDADGYILVVPASRALLFQGDMQLEPESPELVLDPDVNLARIFGSVITYKEQSRGKPIKGIAVVVTKWDMIMPYAQQWGMDLYDPSGEGQKRFMDVCFPATSMTLKSCGCNNIEFFPSYFQVLRDDEGHALKWPEGGDQIEVIQGARTPRYSEKSYVQLFEWLKQFAA
jgi:hypothetical protein